MPVPERSSRVAGPADPLLRDVGDAFDELELSWRVVTPDSTATARSTGSDVVVPAENLAAARRTLTRLGFLQPQALTSRRRSLFVAYHQPTGTWAELTLASELTLTEPRPLRAATLRTWSRALRTAGRLAAPFRRRGLGVALLGPDGAGKSTVAEVVRGGFYFPADSVYMGLYQAGAAGRRRRRPRGVGLVGALARQWGRWLGSQYRRARGRLVLFDRYTYDALLPADQPLSRLARIRRQLLAHACPRPSLIVVLDVPADVLYERKGEHDPALLERHRRRFLELAHRLPGSVVVDAGRDAESVAREVTAQIWRAYASRWN